MHRNKLQTMSLPAQGYVSFDVFDTLIKRSVAKPSDLFDLMENKIDQESGDGHSNFAETRRHAAKAVAEEQAVPVTLEQIYQRLAVEFGSEAFRWMELEIQIELNSCAENPLCVDLFRRCVDAGKIVVLISDMYLSSAVIERMLEKCGVAGYHKLYVSCEMGARKRDGSLFRAVIEDLGIKPSQLIHIGDNWRADYLMPVSLGIHAKHVPNMSKELCEIPQKISCRSELAYRTIHASLHNCTYGMTDKEKMGCVLFGPLLYGFTLWLADQIQKDDIHDVYFVARDGYMMKKAFDLLGISEINTHYLYASRRSFIAPMFWKHPEFSDTMHYIGHVRRISLRNYLVRLGVEPDDYVSVAEKQGLDMDQTVEMQDFISSAKVKDFYELIRGDVRNNARAEYEALVAYIRSLKMDSKIALVDIGYNGSTEEAFEHLLSEEGMDVEVKGYYTAVSPKAFRVLDHTMYMRGYLCDIDHDQENFDTFGRYLPIFEAQFFAPHGSVKRFVIHNDVAEPELYDFEYMLPDGSYSYEYDFIEAYQKGAVELVSYMYAHFPDHPFRVDPDVALYGLNRLGYQPTLAEAKLWGDFHRLSMTYYNVAKPQSPTAYMRHPGQIKRDLMSCQWKIGFMKRLIKLPLPYGRIQKAAKKLLKSKINESVQESK